MLVIYFENNFKIYFVFVRDYYGVDATNKQNTCLNLGSDPKCSRLPLVPFAVSIVAKVWEILWLCPLFFCWSVLFPLLLMYVLVVVVVHLRIIVVRFSHISPKYVALQAVCLSAPVIPFKVWKDEG